MKLAQVIGNVTLSHFEPSLKGGRFLMASPLNREHIQKLSGKSNISIPLRPLSGDFTPVIYDTLGAGVNDIIAYVEGAEATLPFDFPIAIDAYNVAIMNTLNYQPAE